MVPGIITNASDGGAHVQTMAAVPLGLLFGGLDAGQRAALQAELAKDGLDTLTVAA
jgi:hypothetical protein